jgi:hypothetical protein
MDPQYNNYMSEASYFDTSTEDLPTPPRDTRVHTVNFETCPGSDLCIHLILENTSDHDKYGVVSDSWWAICCKDLPDRTIRLFGGSSSLMALLKRYAFMDAVGCINHRRAKVKFTQLSTPLPLIKLKVPAHLIDAIGVPQFYPRSGVCWYSALCWVSFCNPTVCDFIKKRVPPDIARMIDNCLFSRLSAEALRAYLWHTHKIGDNVDDPPENDGRNGFSEFTSLCAAFHIPLLRFKEGGGMLREMRSSSNDVSQVQMPSLCRKSPHFLAIRFDDGDHTRFPVIRRICHAGQRYRLVGMYMGQRKCGHQIGVASTTGDWRDMAIGDADWHKDKIGPMFIQFEGDRWMSEWWNAWKYLVPVTKFGKNTQEFCNLSPHNPPDSSIEHQKISTYRRSRCTGLNSIDMLYINL